MIHPFHQSPEPKLTVRVGCLLAYEAPQPTPIILLVKPYEDHHQKIVAELMTFQGEPGLPPVLDGFGNITHRWILQPGPTTVIYDALVEVSSLPESSNPRTHAVPVDQLPLDVVRFTLPSRYCDSDKLLAFSADRFAGIASGHDRVIAICNWVQANIQYITFSGRPDISASDAISRGFGVCRDFAHAAISLCRALNIPARYVSGHLPDIGCLDSGTPMDFHAYFEVYLEHQWRVFDARFNTPRIGRIKVAHGLDAVDGAFSTIFGPANLTYFEVWAYQVNPAVVSIGSPIDLSKRIDNSFEVRYG